MGSGGRAASEKSRRNEGLPCVLAIFGPHNPSHPTVPGLAAQHQAARRQCEIPSPPGFACDGWGAKPCHCPFQPLTPRRVADAPDSPDNPAEKARAQFGVQPDEASVVDGHGGGVAA